MANSVAAIVQSLSLSPLKWTTQTMNQILEAGDKLYTNTYCSHKYWCYDDIPEFIDSIGVKKCQSFHGYLNSIKLEHPFYTLEEALKISFDQSHVIFTMGNTEPFYTCAAIKDSSGLFFFDPHSRSITGMPTSNGAAVLSFHQTVEDLKKCIKHLSDCLYSNKGDIYFETMTLSLIKEPESSSETSSDFSGFSAQSEGSISCRLFLAEENIERAKNGDFSDISDIDDGDAVDFDLHDGEHEDCDQGSHDNNGIAPTASDTDDHDLKDV
ncbi:hypothetical protein DPMN_087047 [Dreissena polymorpha]|uniref:Uncharacterized protein n=1 Tax=Dreissena polymorpha TaxID=45954 RepID=A0A9D4QWI9_DREPO|nr:hypothetical protein DPMN_087047 [Dreissena polymorpha]